MAMEDDESGETKDIKAAVRSAKKAARPAKIGLPEPAPTKHKRAGKSGDKKKKSSLSKAMRKGTFEADLGSRARAREGAHAKKGGRHRGHGEERR